ncbi:PRC-barrel domain-containing protein [Devosia sp.]|uniref:PRC-barrel domain-containing protein n=1 Tax=Devosia sp. TaxID=1871048 RepID=UPI00292D2ECE|nr:PRC-barrel domain-containing protein [Devosia sp.]
MIRTLLATTALAALLAGGAIAQDAAPAADPAAPATTEAPADPAAPADAAAPAATEATPVESGAMEETDVNEPWDMSAGYVAADTDNLGTRLIGQPVYSSAGDDAEEIGNIDDIVFDENGQIKAVVIAVGGFLGIGEKAVAVDFQQLEFTLAADNTERWVLPTTADALTAAPDFVWSDDEPVDADEVDANADAVDAETDAMAPADPAAPAAPAADNAMAPAADGAAPMAREGYEPLEAEALTAENLTDATVVGPDGEDIAEVEDLLLTQDGKIDAMLVDFGGFLGIGQKRVAVGMENLEFAANADGNLLVYSDFTREQLEAAPEYDEAAYAADPSLRATDL